MPVTALLPLTIAATILLVILAVVLWLRDRRGRGVQLFALALLPVGLYLTGLLTLLWEAVTGLSTWLSRLVFNPAVWTGFGLLAAGVVLWLAGGRWATKAKVQRATAKADGRPAQVSASTSKSLGASKPPAQPTTRKAKPQGKQAAVDPEMDEIEALLRSRGIE